MRGRSERVREWTRVIEIWTKVRSEKGNLIKFKRNFGHCKAVLKSKGIEAAWRTPSAAGLDARLFGGAKCLSRESNSGRNGIVAYRRDEPTTLRASHCTT